MGMRQDARAPLTPGLVVLVYASVAALWIVLSGELLDLSVPDPALREFLEVGKGLLFVAVSSTLLLILLRSNSQAGASPVAGGGFRVIHLVVLVTLVAFVPLMSHGVLRLYAPALERQVFRQLDAIVDLEVRQVELWLDERRRDAARIGADGHLIQHALALLASGADADRQVVEQAFAALVQAYDYQTVVLLDAAGRTVLEHGGATVVPLVGPASPGQAAPVSAARPGLASPLPSARIPSARPAPVVTSALRAIGGGRLAFDVQVPLLGADGAVAATVGLRADPHRLLEMLGAHWSSYGRSAESLLVVEEGDELVFFALRRAGGGAVTWRLPAARRPLLAAQVVKQGGPGVVAGIDYRGQPVFAAYRPLPGTPWHLLGKLDRAEALEPLRRLALWVGVIAFFAVAVVSALLIMLWRQQGRAHGLELRAQAAEHDRLVRRFYELPFIGIAFVDALTQRWLRFNDRLCEMLGYSAEELTELTWMDVTHPDDIATDAAQFDRVRRGESDGYQLDKRYLRKDGSVVHVALAVRREPGGAGHPDVIVAMVQDVTERRLAELAIAKLNRYYVALSRTNEALIRATDPDTILGEVCRIAVEQGDLSLVWVGRLDPTTGRVEPLAVCGEASEYVGRVSISGDETLPEGRGPYGCALREGRSQVVHDFIADARAAPFQSAALDFGLAAALICPLMRAGTAWGAVAFYSREVGYFTPDLVDLLEELSADLAFSLDTLELRQRREDAEHQLLLNAQVLEASHEGIAITDARNRFSMVNDAFCEITGYAREELLGRNPRVLRSGRHDADFYRKVWRSLQAQGRWQGEVWDRRRDGQVFPAWVAITRVADARHGRHQHVAIYADITAHKQAEERIAHLASHDILTNLPNRALLNDRVERAIAHAQRDDARCALLFVDLDRFKLVNDSLGHEVGDEVLRTAATRLCAAVRASDTVARFGGDEFAVLLHDVARSADAARVAGKLLQQLAAPYHVHGHELVLSASIGIAVYPENGRDAATLVRLADTAMLSAKEAGAGTFHFYSEEMGARAVERLQLESELRGATARGEIHAVYQPQVALADGRLVGVEVLARWHHPRHGAVSPARFIPVAEESGLILEIGGWILAEACRQARRWMQEGPGEVPVSVNVSAVQFRQADFVDVVERTLADSGLPPHLLELEVTESVVMAGVEQIRAKLDALHGLGVHLAIDDFGTGYSSLSYLRQFPTQRLKIDQSFVRDLPHSADAAAIARAIVSLGHSLGMTTIAEGVETEAQAAFLHGIDCDDGQGYLYGKPMAPADLVAWWQARPPPPAP